jgi:rhamnulose-1-phosphate aldolase
MKNIINSWFVQGMIKTTSDMWLKGWDERNGGNISLRLSEDDIMPFLPSFSSAKRRVELTRNIPSLANCWFLVTGSGKFFRNIQLSPEDGLVLLKLDENGSYYTIYWGLIHGGFPTSELASHLQSHSVRKHISGDQDRVIMHCHATNFVALSYVTELTSENVTRLLWEGSTECLVVFPDGIGVIPWMVPGTDEIGDATAKEMRSHNLVMWPFHGIFGAGPTLDETFGLIDTVEKSSEIIVKVISMGGMRHSITTEQLIALGQRFGVNPWKKPLEMRFR